MPEGMQLKLNPKSKVPPYQQLFDQMLFTINAGELEKGTRLPSIRSLAAEFNIAPNTVHKAFRMLELKRLIQSKDRSGYVVLGPGRKKSVGRYASRGVSATKDEVHSAVDKLDPGLFPWAFCKVTDDYLGGDPNQCNIIHADGSGTKSILAYLHYRETADVSAFRGIAQDSIVMNLDDILCVGATQRILISSTINRNAINIPAEALAALINGTEHFLKVLREFGVNVYSGGGETADVGDLTPTATVDSVAVTRMEKKDVIAGGIEPGLAIVGLASFGKANYESVENSGIGSNGLTSARHDMLCSYYKENYPETYDSIIDPELVYCGPYRMEDALPESTLTVGQALLSPTRTYAPVILKLLSENRNIVKAMIHCSGGGQTKCRRFGRGVHFIKDNLFSAPPIFKSIQEASKTSWKEMYQVFNMGHRMEIYCKAADVEKVIAASNSFGIAARQVGVTEKSSKEGASHISLKHAGRWIRY